MKEILILVSKHEIFIQLLINLFKYMHRIIIPVPRFKSIFNGCFGFWFLLLFGSQLLSQRDGSQPENHTHTLSDFGPANLSNILNLVRKSVRRGI